MRGSSRTHICRLPLSVYFGKIVLDLKRVDSYYLQILNQKIGHAIFLAPLFSFDESALRSVKCILPKDQSGCLFRNLNLLFHRN